MVRANPALPISRSFKAIYFGHRRFGLQAQHHLEQSHSSSAPRDVLVLVLDLTAIRSCSDPYYR